MDKAIGDKGTMAINEPLEGFMTYLKGRRPFWLRSGISSRVSPVLAVCRARPVPQGKETSLAIGCLFHRVVSVRRRVCLFCNFRLRLSVLHGVHQRRSGACAVDQCLFERRHPASAGFWDFVPTTYFGVFFGQSRARRPPRYAAFLQVRRPGIFVVASLLTPRCHLRY